MSVLLKVCDLAKFHHPTEKNPNFLNEPNLKCMFKVKFGLIYTKRNWSSILHLKKKAEEKKKTTTPRITVENENMPESTNTVKAAMKIRAESSKSVKNNGMTF